jgi:hypothetical protein
LLTGSNDSEHCYELFHFKLFLLILLQNFNFNRTIFWLAFIKISLNHPTLNMHISEKFFSITSNGQHLLCSSKGLHSLYIPLASLKTRLVCAISPFRLFGYKSNKQQATQKSEILRETTHNKPYLSYML